MTSIHNVVQLLLTTSLTNTEIAAATGVSRATVRRYREIAEQRGYAWDALSELPDAQLIAKFNRSRHSCNGKRRPDYVEVHSAMQLKGGTLVVQWERYREVGPEDALGYSQFTEGYRQHLRSIDRTMRQTHLPGQCTFVDFSGLRPHYVDRETGQKVYVELFVGVLGYSNFTFALATVSQKLPDWIEAHNLMFAYFGGVTQVLVPDNLRSAVDEAGCMCCSDVKAMR